jgi:hypothetical protein
MPHVNPRIQVVLPPETKAAIEVVSRLRRMPQSAVIRELLVQATPVLAEIARALEEANRAPERAISRMARLAGDSVEELIQSGLSLPRRKGRPRGSTNAKP